MISIYFGSIGCGKSTFATSVIRKELKRKKYKNIFANFEVVGARFFSCKDLGKYLFEDCLIVCDEAGIEFNNRGFKTLPKEFIEFLKLSRHYNCDLIFLSQAPDDMDITIRRLATQYYLLRKSRVFPATTSIIPIDIKVGINELTKEIVDEYKFPLWFAYPFRRKHVFRPLYYKYFNSFSAPLLPLKYYPVVKSKKKPKFEKIRYLHWLWKHRF